MNELILAVDTTSEFGSLALLSGEAVQEEVPLHSPEGFSHILYAQIAGLLQRHGIGVGDIHCFAATSGPGLFTGVRIGLACIKGLAEATGKRTAPVSTLRTLASFGAGSLRAVVVDARREQIYGGLYDAELNALAPETVGPFSVWLRSLPAAEIEFISPDFAPFAGEFRGTRFQTARQTVAPRALAAAVGRIALRMLRLGQTLDPADVDANYVRRSDAELFWKE